METVTDFIFLGFKITVDGDCSHGIKIGRRNINNLRYADDTTLMAERRGPQEPLDEGKGGE